MRPPKSIAVPINSRSTGGKGRPAPESEAPQDLGAARETFHAYRVGQRLQMRNGGNVLSRAAGPCQVISLLPHESGPPLYRVQSEAENFERIVAEADLSLID